MKARATTVNHFCFCCPSPSTSRFPSISIRLFIYVLFFFWPALLGRLIILCFWCGGGGRRRRRRSVPSCARFHRPLESPCLVLCVSDVLRWRLQHLQVYCFAPSDNIRCWCNQRTTDIWPPAARTRPLQLPRCVAHLARVHCRSHSVRSQTSEFSPSAGCVLSRLSSWPTPHCSFVADSNTDTHTPTTQSRFYFMRYFS